MAAGVATTRFAGQNFPGCYLVHPYDRGQNCTCDVFIVHGLRGGATSSWQHPRSGTIWFQHLLPDLIRDLIHRDVARIWTFGYAANVTFQTSTIYDFAQNLLNRVNEVRRGNENRKIIWVCHSLGGVIVKQALVDAKITSRYQSIHASTTGIIFLGTPHNGSSYANLGNVVASIVSLVTPGFSILNRDIFKELRRSSAPLFELSSRFSNISSGISIHSFYETVPQRGTNLVVDRSSAILNLSNEVTRHPLAMTHQELGKFADAYDQNWQSVASSFSDLLLLTESQTQSVPAPVAPYPTSPSMPGPWQSRPENSNMSPPWQQRAYSPAPSSSSPRPTPLQTQPQRNPAMMANDPWYSEPQGQPQARAPVPPRKVPVGPSPANKQSARPRNGYSAAPTASSSYPTLHMSQARMSLRPPEMSQSQRPASPRSSPSNSRYGSPSVPNTTWERPAGPAAPHTERRSAPSPDEASTLCDCCGSAIPDAEHRVQCTVCYDYDLCSHCFQAGKTSKDHAASHKMSYVTSLQALAPDNLVPVHERVNPQKHASGKENWSVETVAPNTPDNPKDTSASRRWLHLFAHDSHARFRADVKPGHYGLSITVGVRFDKELGDGAKRTLLTQPSGVGRLRVTVGPVRDNRQFFGGQFAEDTFTGTQLGPAELPNLLLSSLCGVYSRIDVGDTMLTLQPAKILHVSGPEDSLTGLGLILQWSGVSEWSASNDPIVSLTVLRVGMYNILNYDEPYVRAPPPPQPRPAIPPAPANKDDDDEGPSAQEFLEALLGIQQAVETAQERARLEAALREQLAMQEQAKRDAVVMLYRKAMAEAIQEAQAEQEKRQLEAAVFELLQNLGRQ